MFLPRGIPHTFRIKSPVARMLNYITPGGFENFFSTIGTPATSFELPVQAGPPTEELLSKIGRVSAMLGVSLIPGPVDL